MSKMLHEIIAVESGKVAAANHIVEEAGVTFIKRTEHFNGHSRVTTMFDESRQGENTSEIKEVVETIPSKLDWVWEAVGSAMDVTATKEASNFSPLARANVVVEAVTVMTDVPATVLLGLEKRLTQLFQLYTLIPTLDPTYLWATDDSVKPGEHYTVNPVEQLKTEKTLEHKVLYAATKEHPAQIEKYSKDTPVGKIVQNRKSGMVSVADKAMWLKRITQLQVAVKEARQRANKADVVDFRVASSIHDFIHSA